MVFFFFPQPRADGVEDDRQVPYSPRVRGTPSTASRSDSFEEKLIQRTISQAVDGWERPRPVATRWRLTSRQLAWEPDKSESGLYQVTVYGLLTTSKLNFDKYMTFPRDHVLTRSYLYQLRDIIFIGT